MFRALDLDSISKRLYYYDKISNTNHLFIIHRWGIIKYNLSTQKVEKEYVQKLMFNDFVVNTCCIDPNNGIIYMNIHTATKIIIFDMKKETWNFDFLAYDADIDWTNLMTGLNSLRQQCTMLEYCPIDGGDIRFQVAKVTGSEYECTIYNSIQNKSMVITEHGETKANTTDLFFKHHPYYTNQQLYMLKQKLSSHPGIDLDKILEKLFQTTFIRDLIQCHTAWNQIIFFIFEQEKGYWSIDCIDILEPERIKMSIGFFEKPEFGLSTFCFDKYHDLYHVYTDQAWYSGEVRSKKFNTKELITFISRPMLSYIVFWT